MQFLVYVFFFFVCLFFFFLMKQAIPFISLLFHCICIRRVYGLNLVLVQNFSNWCNCYFLLLCIHYHNVEQWQIKLKPVKKTLNQGQI